MTGVVVRYKILNFKDEESSFGVDPQNFISPQPEASSFPLIRFYSVLAHSSSTFIVSGWNRPSAITISIITFLLKYIVVYKMKNTLRSAYLGHAPRRHRSNVERRSNVEQNPLVRTFIIPQTIPLPSYSFNGLNCTSKSSIYSRWDHRF